MKKSKALIYLALALALGPAIPAKAYRDLETGEFLTKDPLGIVSPAGQPSAGTPGSYNIMMPKEKWYVDGKEVTQQEYEAACEPGVPQVQTGPTKSAKNGGQEAGMHLAVASGDTETPGQKSHWHTAAAGSPNLYTYVNQNPWTFFDPEGLDVTATFDRKSGTFTVTDNQNPKKTVTVNNVVSGNGQNTNKPSAQHIPESGPAPGGKYLIGNAYQHPEPDHPGDMQWYKLYGQDGKGGYSYQHIPIADPSGKMADRGYLNLHTGRASDGCVTFWSDAPRGAANYPSSAAYNQVKQILDTTAPMEYKGSTYRGVLIVK